MLRLDGLSLAMGDQDLLHDAHWHLRPGVRAGLIGRNGTGKSTLLRAIIGQVQPEAGRILLRGDARLGYLPQQAVSGSTLSVWDESRSQMAWLHTLEQDYARALKAAEEGEAGGAERLGQVSEQMRLRGAFSAEERIGSVLSGLGFASEDWTRSCAELSGGWQMRVALARLLLSEPNLLLLDEPTNHLDIRARSWLAQSLADWPGTMLIVSHDRHLLDTVCTEVVEVRNRTLTSFSGNLSAWLAERQRRQDALLAAKDRQDQEVAKLERFVERFGAKANKASQAQSKQKALNRIDRIELPEHEGRPRLRLPEPPAGALEPVSLRNVTLAWPDGEPVLRGVDLTLERGMRLAVLGPNGAGKSTLVSALAGTLAPVEGQRRLGKDVRISRYAQDLAQELPADKTALEVVEEQVPMSPVARMRAALGALGLRGESQLRPVGQLSGGEKARVVLAAFACRAANLLFLDEPTNHLDAITVEVLADALAAFEGTIVLVTHDRFLVERVATHVAHVGDGRVELHAGVLPSDFLPAQGRTGTDGAALERTVEVGEGLGDWEQRKQRSRDAERARKRLIKVHQEIEAGERRLGELDEKLVQQAADHKAVAALARERATVEGEIAGLYAEWERLEEG